MFERFSPPASVIVPLRTGRRVLLPILVVGLVVALLPSSPSGAAEPVQDGALSVTSMSTEHRVRPLGIDNRAPRLAWLLSGSRRGEAQTAAQVQVATSPEALAGGDLAWDSGRLDTAEQNVDWAGPALRSSQRYQWRVRTWDSKGDASAWSDASWFETGLLDASDWDGSTWIGAGAGETVGWAGASWVWHPPADLPVGAAAGTRYLRREFALPSDATITTATMLAVADNHFRLFVNGVEVGHGDDWAQPQRLDVTEAIRPGDNVVAVEVTNDPDPGVNTGPAGFLGSLRIKLDDGSTTNVRTDAQWRSSDAVEPGWQEVAFDDSHWGAVQVVAAQGAGPWGAVPQATSAAPQLRKEISVDRPVARARAYYSGIGISELRINGRRIGDEELSPSFSDYTKRVYYVTRDVTDAIREGENAVGVTLGRGWYSMTTKTVWNFDRAPWRAEPALRMKLVLDYADGTSDTIVSDSSWRWADSPTKADSLHLGETYDARDEQAGWDAKGFDDSSWHPASVVPGPAGTLRAESMQPIRRAGTVRPVRITPLPTGAYVVDFGEVITGWARLNTAGQVGDEVQLRYGEQLRPDGTVANEQQHITGDVQVDRYVFRSDHKETWEPRFSYKSFRYVELRGLRSMPDPGTLTGIYLHSDLAQTGSFTSSNPLFNRMHEAMVRTTLNNLHGYPTDSPMFEKNGWADFNLWAEDTLLNLDAMPLVSKWLGDVSDAQAPDGRIPAIVPDSGWGMGIDAIEWGSAGVLVPWFAYQRTGDDRLLARQYASMRAYTERKVADSPGLLANSVLGDWISPGYLTPPEGARLTATAYLFHDLEIMRDTAALLGRTADKERYAGLVEQSRSAFLGAFYDADRKVFRTETDAGFRQTSQILPLALGLVPTADRAAVVANLAQDITKAHNGHLNTGSIGTRYLLPVLTAEAQGDVAYRVATQTTYPSWGNWFVNGGATTIWEGWDLTSRSRNHAFLGTIDQWFYEQLAGIQPASAGYRSIDIAPHPLGDLTSASATVGTPFGDVVSSWQKRDWHFELDVEVPVGSTARVLVPVFGDPADPRWTPSGSSGARLVGVEGDRGVFEVGSGSWRFRSRLPEKAQDAPPQVYLDAPDRVLLVDGVEQVVPLTARSIEDGDVTAPVTATATEGFEATVEPSSVVVPAGGTAELALTLRAVDPSVDSGTVVVDVGGRSTTIDLESTDNVARIATMSASSTHPWGFSPAKANDGDTTPSTDFALWNAGGGWNDGTASAYPDTLTASWSQPQQVSEVAIYTLDAASFPASQFGVRDVDVEGLVDGAWLPLAQVRGNIQGLVEISFEPVTAEAVRLVVHATNSGDFSRVVEFEAYR